MQDIAFSVCPNASFRVRTIGPAHSGLVKYDVDLGSKPRTSRLTANMIVDSFPLDERNRA